MGAYAGSRIGAIRDAKGRSVLAVCPIICACDCLLTV